MKRDVEDRGIRFSEVIPVVGGAPAGSGISSASRRIWLWIISVGGPGAGSATWPASEGRAPTASAPLVSASIDAPGVLSNPANLSHQICASKSHRNLLMMWIVFNTIRFQLRSAAYAATLRGVAVEPCIAPHWSEMTGDRDGSAERKPRRR